MKPGSPGMRAKPFRKVASPSISERAPLVMVLAAGQDFGGQDWAPAVGNQAISGRNGIQNVQPNMEGGLAKLRRYGPLQNFEKSVVEPGIAGDRLLRYREGVLARPGVKTQQRFDQPVRYSQPRDEFEGARHGPLQ